MPFYRYRAKDSQGELRDGELESKNLRSAVAELQQKGYTVLQVQQCRTCACGLPAPPPGQSCPECGRVAGTLGPLLVKAGLLTGFVVLLGKVLHFF